jgi:hypothetical protein
MVMESVDPEYFVPHVDLTKVAENAAEAAKGAGRTTRRWACCGTSSVSCRPLRSRNSAAGPAVLAANWHWRATRRGPERAKSPAR